LPKKKTMNQYKIILLSTAILVVGNLFAQEKNHLNSDEIRLQQIKNIHNPELWDMERLNEDIIPEDEIVPIKFGAYPVPQYDSLGPYRGGGFVGNLQARSVEEYKLMVEDKEVVFNSFFIGDSPFYAEEQRNRVFFTIITVADSLDANNYVPGMTLMTSRNHPDYGGEGSVITANNKIDYVTFTTPDKGDFAIVNMRLFHLEHGNIIVVVPQKDGSLRSLQVKGKKVTNEEVLDYLKNDILKREDVAGLIKDEKGI